MSQHRDDEIQSLPPSSEALAEHARRWQRVMDCVNLKTPDRMPVGLQVHFWLAKYGGFNCRDQMYDYEKVKDTCDQMCREFEPDLFGSPLLMTTVGPMLEAIGFKQLQWPGHGVGDNQSYQYLDREYMTADEYDDFLFDPTGFYLEKYLPRVADAYRGLEGLASLAGKSYFAIGWGAMAFTNPAMRQSFDKLEQAGGVVQNYIAHEIDHVRRITALGTPTGYGCVAVAPYDTFADYYRGATGMMKDLFRRGGKVLEALEKMTTLTVRQTLAQAKMTSNPLVFIPVHWAPDAFMSQKQFETFWWPSYKKMVLAFIDAGLVPMTMWEADCTKRLETLRELPAGKCLHWFERTDLVRAFEVLGDVAALRGGLLPSLLNMGTPADVDAAVKHLADNIWHKGGKLILDGGFGIPDEAPIENVRAMYAAARKYGS